MTINFGSVGGRRCVTFKVSNDGKVVPVKFRKGGWDFDGGIECLAGMGELISAHESFRRWKRTRKAWRTRRGNNHQLQMLL